MASTAPIAWLSSSDCSSQRQGPTSTSLAFAVPQQMNYYLPGSTRARAFPQTNTKCFALQSVGGLPTYAEQQQQQQQQQQWNVTRNQCGKRTRVDEHMQHCYAAADFRPDEALVSQSSFDDLYRHCLKQAEQLSSKEISLQSSPLSDSTYVAAEQFYPFASSTQRVDAHTTPSFPVSGIAAGAPRPGLPASRYPVLSQFDHLQLASPSKRRRYSYSEDYGESCSRYPASFNNHVDVKLEDPLLKWSKEQARQAINDYDRRISRESYHSTSCSPVEPFGQLLSQAASNSTNVSESLHLWLSSLQIPADSTANLAFHIWSRVAPQACRQSQLPIASVVSACLWIALKLQEHRLVVPSTTRLSQVCRVSRRELRKAELCVMSWVDWAPLKHWDKL